MPVISSPNSIYSHSTTGINLLKRALRIIRAIDPGEDLTAGEVNDGKEALNQMLDSWNAERLTVPALSRQEFAMISGQQTYTIGPAGDFDSSQVVKIERGDAWIKEDTLELRLAVISQEAWAGIPIKSTSGKPQALYYEMGSPTGNVNFYFVPDKVYTLVLYRRQLLAQVVEMGASIQLLPGYADAIVFNLGLRQAPEYGSSASPETIMLAGETKATIKRNNIKPGFLAGDPALLHHFGSGIQFDRTASAGDGWGEDWGGEWSA